jgi:hypothetical protein
MHAQTAVIENGFVYIPEAAPWLAEYLHEMTVFPRGKHDDQVDSTAQFLDWCKRPFRARGFTSFCGGGWKTENWLPNRRRQSRIGLSAPWNGKPSRKKPSRRKPTRTAGPDPARHTDQSTGMKNLEPSASGPRVRIPLPPAVSLSPQ